MSQSAQTGHSGINVRLPASGRLYGWEFEKCGSELKVRVEGRLVFNNVAVPNAALAGFDLAPSCSDDEMALLERENVGARSSG